MDDLASTSALLPIEKSSNKKVVGIHEVDTLTKISTQLVALAKEIDSQATNQTMSAFKAARPRDNHCDGNDEGVDCNVRRPFVKSAEEVNYMKNYPKAA